MKRYLQQWAIRTNPWWPFSSLNRFTYTMAIRYWVRACRKFPQIKSVYLRDSLTNGDWTPGISDIDLTVVIKNDLTAAEELGFLANFWHDYECIKRVFPMLGEVDVFDEKSMALWCRFGIRGYESASWQRVYGTETRAEYGASSADRRREEALNHALKFFKTLFWEEFFRESAPSWNLRRMAKKIGKYASYGFADNRIPCTGGESKERLLLLVLTELDNRVKPLNDVISRLRTSDPVESVLFFEGGVFQPVQEPTYLVLLKDGLDEASLEKGIRDALNRFTCGKNPLIMTSSVFKYILFVQDALSYDELKRRARLELGPDPFGSGIGPGEEARIRAAVDRLAHALSYPRRQKLLSMDLSRFIYSYLVQEMLTLKLFVEKNEYIANRHRLLERYRELYPEYYRRIESFRDNRSHLEFFSVVRDLLSDAQRGLVTAGAHEK